MLTLLPGCLSVFPTSGCVHGVDTGDCGCGRAYPLLWDLFPTRSPFPACGAGRGAMPPRTGVEELRQEGYCKFKDSLYLTDTLSSTRPCLNRKETTVCHVTWASVPYGPHPQEPWTGSNPLTRPPVQAQICEYRSSSLSTGCLCTRRGCMCVSEPWRVAGTGDTVIHHPSR